MITRREATVSLDIPPEMAPRNGLPARLSADEAARPDIDPPNRQDGGRGGADLSYLRKYRDGAPQEVVAGLHVHQLRHPQPGELHYLPAGFVRCIY